MIINAICNYYYNYVRYVFVCFLFLSDITFEPICDKSNLDIGQIEWLFLLYAENTRSYILFNFVYLSYVFIKNK